MKGDKMLLDKHEIIKSNLQKKLINNIRYFLQPLPNDTPKLLLLNLIKHYNNEIEDILITSLQVSQ